MGGLIRGEVEAEVEVEVGGNMAPAAEGVLRCGSHSCPGGGRTRRCIRARSSSRPARSGTSGCSGWAPYSKTSQYPQ